VPFVKTVTSKRGRALKRKRKRGIKKAGRIGVPYIKG